MCSNLKSVCHYVVISYLSADPFKWKECFSNKTKKKDVSVSRQAQGENYIGKVQKMSNFSYSYSIIYTLVSIHSFDCATFFQCFCCVMYILSSLLFLNSFCTSVENNVVVYTFSFHLMSFLLSLTFFCHLFPINPCPDVFNTERN